MKYTMLPSVSSSQPCEETFPAHNTNHTDGGTRKNYIQVSAEYLGACLAAVLSIRVIRVIRRPILFPTA